MFLKDRISDLPLKLKKKSAPASINKQNSPKTSCLPFIVAYANVFQKRLSHRPKKHLATVDSLTPPNSANTQLLFLSILSLWTYRTAWKYGKEWTMEYASVAYPIYKSLEALVANQDCNLRSLGNGAKTKEERQQLQISKSPFERSVATEETLRRWLIYWVSYGILRLLPVGRRSTSPVNALSFLMPLSSLFPALRLVFLWWLQSPTSKGAEIVFTRLWKPLFAILFNLRRRLACYQESGTIRLTDFVRSNLRRGSVDSQRCREKTSVVVDATAVVEDLAVRDHRRPMTRSRTTTSTSMTVTMTRDLRSMEEFGKDSEIAFASRSFERSRSRSPTPPTSLPEHEKYGSQIWNPTPLSSITSTDTLSDFAFSSSSALASSDDDEKELRTSFAHPEGSMYI